MANISSMMSTTNTTSTYQSNGIAGLASGMDTEAVVEAMTSDIQAKIDKIKQQQTKYEWKQDAYREVITLLTEFQDKYFSYSNPATNVLSSALYNCVNKVAQGANADKISVTSSSNKDETAYNVTGVTQLASKAQYIGESMASTGGITTGAISFGNRDTNMVAGKELSFKYDNVEYSITVPEDFNISKDNQAEDLAAALNKALSEQTVNGSTVKLSERLKFEASGDKLTMKTVSSTDSRAFEITAIENALKTSTGFDVGDRGNSTTAITGDVPVEVIKEQAFSLEGKKLSFEYNGLSKTIAFTKEESDAIMAAGDDAAKLEKMRETIQNKVDDTFGSGKITVAADTTKMKLNFNASDATSTLAMSSTTLDTMGKNGIFGITNGISNRLDTSKTLKELGVEASFQKQTGTTKDENGNDVPVYEDVYRITVNGKDFDFSADTQLSTVLNKINGDKDAGINISYLNTTNKFSITSDEYGEAEKINISGNIATTLFGGTIGDAVAGQDAAKGTFKAGQDLQMTIRYAGESEDTIITRNSNNVSLDGVNFTVNEKFGNQISLDGNGNVQVDVNGKPIVDVVADSEAISFKNESDTENAVKVIKEMADAYNVIVDKINEYVTTKQARTSSGKNGSSTYEPLTEAQKKEMTEDEIKSWEKKAKEGILFGDSTLRQLASQLRFAFSAAVGEHGFAEDIGIEVATSYSGNGKITINEAKLTEALKNDPDKVKAMFTASETEAKNSTGFGMSGGFVTRVKSIMEDYAKTTGSYKGKLVELAGLKNNATTDNNYIARQQKLLTNRLDYFEDLLAARQRRYQNQFSSLEVYISRMNSQSSYLSSAFSY